MPPFFDTNVLIYSVSANERKADRAFALIEQGGWISVQVLNEMARVLRSKLNYHWPTVQLTLAKLQVPLRVAPVDLETHQIGLELAERHTLAIFDAMIVAAALQAGCTTLYSEDMHHGLVIGKSLTITNPFRA